jgi:CheY-like chemotaxis protein
MSESTQRLGRRSEASARPRRVGRVLIVDDSWDAREMYALYFRARGYDAMTASDGDAGIEFAIKAKPDVIVMDLAMPRLSGISAAHQLKNDPRTRRIPIILLTGHGHRAVDEGLFKMGIDVFLTKPCLPEDLEGHVRRLLEERQPT